jgi:hypothetical protein
MKSLHSTLFLIVSFIIFCSSTLVGQQEQVAFKHGVFEIDQNVRQQLGILDKYKENYQTARLLRDENNKYFVEITYLKRGITWTEKYELSQSELESIRNSIGSINISPSSTSINKTQNGRYGLITSATLHSIYQGIFLSQLMSTDDGRTKVGRIFPYIFATGTFATTLVLTNNKYINPAAANVHFWSSGIGLAHGSAIMLMVEDEYDYNHKLLSVIGVTSLAEGWLMYYLARRNNIDYARSMAWNTGNIWGTLGGAYLSNIVIEDIIDESPGRQIFGASLIAGGIGGVFLMNHLQHKFPRSSGDFRAINSLGIASTVFGAGLIFESESIRGGSLYGLLSSTAGLALGYVSTVNTSFTQMEGALIGVGTGVAGLLGIGIASIVDNDSLFGVSALVGGCAMAGWLGTYLYFTQTGHRAAKKKEDKKMNYNFGINPSGLVFMKSAPEQQYNMLRNSVNMDLVSFRAQF